MNFAKKMGLPTLVRVTQFNVKHYVGFECIYNHGRGRNKSGNIATITKTSKSGKSISPGERQLVGARGFRNQIQGIRGNTQRIRNGRG